MANDEFDNKIQECKTKNYSAFVVGYTGAIGKLLVEELAEWQVFKKIVLIGRREVKLKEGDKYACVEQKLVDFDNLEEHSSAFAGCDIGYCCLGTTRKQAGKEGFIRVDKDYVMSTARVAKQQGCKQFHLVSSQGSNEKSSFLYTRIKGEVENEIKTLEFDNFVFYRPGILIVERENKRCGEQFMFCCLAPVICCCPTAISTPGTKLTRAMFNKTVIIASLDNTISKWECIENAEIQSLSDM